jgi:hypothetical protein
VILGAAASGHEDAVQYIETNLPRRVPPRMLPLQSVTSEPEVRERWQQEVDL